MPRDAGADVVHEILNRLLRHCPGPQAKWGAGALEAAHDDDLDGDAMSAIVVKYNPNTHVVINIEATGPCLERSGCVWRLFLCADDLPCCRARLVPIDKLPIDLDGEFENDKNLFRRGGIQVAADPPELDNMLRDPRKTISSGELCLVKRVQRW